LPERSLVEALRVKVGEAVERTDHLALLRKAACLAAGKAAQQLNAMDVGHLLGHLRLSFRFLCRFQSLPEHPRILISPGLAEPLLLTEGSQRAHCRIWETNRTRVPPVQRFRFEACSKTIFARKGETLMTLLLGNLEHLLNHKYQLFLYIKLGRTGDLRDLYQFRGE
jgi:hypothetical protein